LSFVDLVIVLLESTKSRHQTVGFGKKLQIQ
jgi:hypothetical protein